MDQIGQGEAYHELRPSIGICLLNTNIWRGAEYHTQFRLRTISGQELTKCLEINILELPKFPIPDNNFEWSQIDPRDAWLYFFLKAGEADTEDTLKKLNQPVFHEAMGVLEMISRDEEQRMLYRARQKQVMDEHWRQEVAKLAVKEAFAEGKATGLLEGEARGEVRGRAEGMIEGEIRLIHALQGLLDVAATPTEELLQKSLEQLQAVSTSLQELLRSR